jgi:hypothetical protein
MGNFTRLNTIFSFGDSAKVSNNINEQIISIHFVMPLCHLNNRAEKVINNDDR